MHSLHNIFGGENYCVVYTDIQASETGVLLRERRVAHLEMELTLEKLGQFKIGIEAKLGTKISPPVNDSGIVFRL